MFSTKDIGAIELPAKTLCLTYDDGPGQYTEAIAEFLHSKGVRATFFVVGKYACEHPEILQKMHRWGHIIGNHTFEHPDMPIYVANDGDIRDQIIRTNVCIEAFNRNKITYFRAPYGKWSAETANELNVALGSSYRMCGPVHWDIPGFDCYFWKIGKSVDETVNAYIEEIESQGKGVIVMHDEIADMDVVKPLNKTLELTRKLIPVLLEKGYRFVGLDEIQDRRLQEAAGDAFALISEKGSVLEYTEKEGTQLQWGKTTYKESRTHLTLERLGHGKVALKTLGGLYLMVNPDVDANLTLTSKASEYTRFDEIPLNGAWMQFRSHNGHYFGGKGTVGETLKADAPFMLQALKLMYRPVREAYVPPVSMAQKFRLVKKKLLFIKSKLF